MLKTGSYPELPKNSRAIHRHIKINTKKFITPEILCEIETREEMCQL